MSCHQSNRFSSFGIIVIALVFIVVSRPAIAAVFIDVSEVGDDLVFAGSRNNNYCPNATVTRDQKAVFFVRTFGL